MTMKRILVFTKVSLIIYAEKQRRTEDADRCCFTSDQYSISSDASKRNYGRLT